MPAQRVYYVPPPPPPSWSPNNNRVAAGVVGLFLGALGIHKFILGFPGAGVAMLLISVLTCGYGAVVMAIVGFIEGIIYLSSNDADFHQNYVVNRRQWF